MKKVESHNWRSCHSLLTISQRWEWFVLIFLQVSYIIYSFMLKYLGGGGQCIYFPSKIITISTKYHIMSVFLTQGGLWLRNVRLFCIYNTSTITYSRFSLHHNFLLYFYYLCKLGKFLKTTKQQGYCLIFFK